MKRRDSRTLGDYAKGLVSLSIRAGICWPFRPLRRTEERNEALPVNRTRKDGFQAIKVQRVGEGPLQTRHLPLRHFRHVERDTRRILRHR